MIKNNLKDNNIFEDINKDIKILKDEFHEIYQLLDNLMKFIDKNKKIPYYK